MTKLQIDYYVGYPDRDEHFFPAGIYRDYVDGRDGNDFIFALNGDDTLYGGLGKDFVHGGYGDDTIYGDRSYNDEAFSVFSRSSAFADALFGGPGNDMIFGGGGKNYVNGGEDDDFIQGGLGSEWLDGGAGNDSIFAGGGSDTLYGGTGSTERETAFINYNIGEFSASWNGLDDTEKYYNFGNAAADDASHDKALTGTGNDTLDGGDGDDIIDGQDGADTMIGGAGNDRFYVDNVSDVVKEYEGDGSDYVLASVSYGLKAGVEVERLSTTSSSGASAISLTGNDFGQRIDGNAAGNKLVGLGGNDTLYGIGGNDALYGGDGKDTLTSGMGNDQFQFDTALGSANIDTIADFHNVSGDNDTIRLENAIFTKLTATGALNAANLAANATGTAADGDDYIVYNTSTGALFYDADGNGAGNAIQFASVTGHPALTVADFLVV